MTIPAELQIGGHRWKVREMRMDNCGELDRSHMTILLADWLPQTQKESTFFHEVLHAINNELDHALLDSLAEQLYQVFAENGLLK